MKCPYCDAATDILTTRQVQNYVRRRRACYNGHRFTTKEFAIPGLTRVVTAAETGQTKGTEDFT